MAQIHILDSETIDKIAAGEVVERPASVVKELVENAIDAGATAITVEAKDGGTTFIRVTDNGSGMEATQLRTAFMRHATSKIENADDLTRIVSLGFRGEALSSIAAVAKVEVITKTKDNLTGTRILLEGAREISFEEVGAPDGTTFLVKNLFFNTPVRRKFLKTAATEGGYISDLMEHLALSRPDISFKFVLGAQTKFHTSGNRDLKEVIYRIFGRETASMLVPVKWERDGITVDGYLGKPTLVRSNRNFEIYFINGRFIRSNAVSKAIEEGYKEYLMQHKFPFCVLQLGMDTAKVDVNVHPTKMDVRFSNPIEFYNLLCGAVRDSLKQREMIPEAKFDEPKREKVKAAEAPKPPQPAPAPPKVTEAPAPKSVSYFSSVPEPFEKKRSEAYRVMEETKYKAEAEVPEAATAPVQMNLFEEKLLTPEKRAEYQLIGQVFDTYWMIEFDGKLLIIDQHAAHEKVKYERLMKQYKEKQIASQQLLPPEIVSLTGQEEAAFREYEESFFTLGFEVEAFGGKEYALRGVPTDLYGCSAKEMFLEVLDELSCMGTKGNVKAVEEKIASMSCKAAVKGNMRMSRLEAQKLIDELLTLENPYNCPHGRPTVITMSKQELEKKFKRIV